MKIAHKIVQVPEMKFLLRPFIHNVKRNNQNIHEIFQEKSHVYFRSLIRFCHILYISKHINLIIKEEAHLSLTVDNKIVTKKNEEIRLVVGFLCKGNKRQLPAKKETRLLPYNSFFKSSMSGRALRSRSGISLEARYVATPIGLL